MHTYPGLGLPLRYNGSPVASFYPVGAHRDCEGALSDLLPAREVAMMNIMEKFTDKPNWHEKVFDDLIVSRWREEVLRIPDKDLWDLVTSGKQQIYNDDGSIVVQAHYSMQGVVPLTGILTEKVFDHCINELRIKASYYAKSNIVPTLDACASIAKSDKLVGPKLHQQLLDAFAILQNDQALCPYWHPHSNSMTRDLVHPSLYPLVYGRSKVIQPGLVGVRDAINRWSGRGDVLEHARLNPQCHCDIPQRQTFVPSDYWSEKYQWLPANVSFQDDGSVKFTSYVNNLHPIKYSGIYQTIERLISAALPAWDQCLMLNTGTHEIVKVGAGRMHSRFSASMPENMGAVVDWDQLRNDRTFFYDPNRDDEAESKWQLLRTPRIPEPVVENIEYTRNHMSLAERFRESGLQIIVKMTSIELSPEKPEYPIGGWHIEGQMNEHICATALYYVDSKNITSSGLSFRMQTPSDIDQEDTFAVGQDNYRWLEQIYGTTLGSGDSPCLQNYGSIETREGRLLTFPNVFQHQVSSFKLIDPTKPGHRRFIALWLVDPNIHIISTANVPPQRRDWWSEATLGYTPKMREEAYSKLPPDILSLIDEGEIASDREMTLPKGAAGYLPSELAELVRKYFGEDGNGSLMGKDEANRHRLNLMEERSRFVKKEEEGWQANKYSFCEH